MVNSQNKQKRIKVLLEMRPATQGFAGIPQETRLLFRGLSLMDNVALEGMIQSSDRFLSRGLIDYFRLVPFRHTEARKLNRLSRVIISMTEKPYKNLVELFLDWISKGFKTSELTIGVLLGITSVKLTRFESCYFEDFIWREFFSKTLPASDFDLVTSKNHKVCSVPWDVFHTVGLNTLNISPSPRYPYLDTKGIDVFITQTPFPARLAKGTKMVVRYHDAIPVFMPHTIPNKSRHQAIHFYALESNVNSGAYFSCISETTRNELLKLFPNLGERAVTIHNMISHHYYVEKSNKERVSRIVRSRLYSEIDGKAKKLGIVPSFRTLREKEAFYTRSLSKEFNYLLMTASIEPRKNHSRLLAAWEIIKEEYDPSLKLIFVGGLGVDIEPLVKNFTSWIERGELFMLNAVPAPDLRVLYRHAAATVCPSLGEGFDFSGVEAMASGGIAVASDIPVHREIYDDAAEYFDPYATMSLVKALKKVLYEPDSAQVQERLRQRGEEVAARYRPEKILPQWEAFLQRVISKQS